MASSQAVRVRPLNRFVPSLTLLEDRTAPTVNVLSAFNGIRFGDTGAGSVPPDTTMGVSATRIVESVNSAVAIYNKAGTQQSIASLQSFFGLAGGAFVFDPVVVYDDIADRFVVLALERTTSPQGSKVWIAVSDTNSPTNLTTDWDEKRSIDVLTTVGANNFWADYPKLGYNAEGYFVTLNMFPFSSGGVHTQIVAIDKSTYLDQNSATGTEYKTTRTSQFFTMAAPVMHGSVAGDPYWLISENGFGSGTQVVITRMTNFLSATPTFTNTVLQVNNYNGGNLPNATQTGGRVITTNDSRLLNAEWRNNRLVTTHSIEGSDGATKVSWYEFSTAGAAPTKIQEGIINPGNNVAAFFPAIAINSAGDIGITYMQTSSSENISIYAAGRLAGDPTGTMRAGVRTHAGLASYNDFSGSPYRAGDYAGIGVDPSDDTFWFANEFADARSTNNWTTGIGNFSVSNTPPIARANGPYTVTEGGTVVLSSAGSNDPDGTISAFQWDFDYDGVTFDVDATGATPTFAAGTADGPGTRTIGLRVRDNNNALSQVDTAIVNITNKAPTVTISGPTTVVENTAVTLTANITEPSTADVNAGFTTVWTVLKNGIAFTDFTGQGTASISFTDPDAPLAGNTYTVNVSVKDKDNGEGTAAHGLQVSSGKPTATFSNDGPKDAPAVVNFSFANQVDPSQVDFNAGFLYSYDFNNNGNFTDPGDILNSTLPAATFNFTTFGTYVVQGRITDKDGDSTDYTTTVTINKVGNGGVIHTFLTATGADFGGGPHVKVFNTDGSLRFSIFPFNAMFTGGVRVATGDVNGDGIEDIITAAGPGGGPHIKVFSGADGSLIRNFFPLPTTYSGGIFVASADVNKDNFDDIIVSNGGNLHSAVLVFSGKDLSPIMGFSAYPWFTKAAVYVAAGDVDGDGYADIVTGVGPGGGPHIRAISGLTGQELFNFFPFPVTYSGGVTVALGDLNRDGKKDVIAGMGVDPNNDSRVAAFNAVDRSKIWEFVAYAGYKNGVRVATDDVNGDGVADIIVSAGGGRDSRVIVLNGTNLTAIRQFYAYDPTFLGGVYVG